jgi:hypothetical protein
VILGSLAESLGLHPVVIGAILECQIDYLNRYLWKEEVPRLIESLIRVSKRTYSSNHPVRHARLVRKIPKYLRSLSLTQESLLGRQLEYIYYTKQLWKDAEETGAAAITLLSNQVRSLQTRCPDN